MSESFDHRPIRIGILLYPEVEELDFTGPYEVFANSMDTNGIRHCEVRTIGTHHEIKCHGGLRVISNDLITDPLDIDALLVPGGPGARENYADEIITAFLQKQREQTPIIASVCTGAFFLAGSGLLDGHRATTHPARFDLFRKLFPHIPLLEEKIVDEGSILTAGGISSGIDLALYLIEKWINPEARKRAAKRLDGPWI